ncbi:hypothetical protein ACIPYS_20580 [Kitasatospora sp. NPDC089913]|uniref:hypothetical protein n=1 Tax=Kitasatospora sp. NPDC089913 TaxID=3364080 RepID=UPI0037FA293D
MSTAETVAAAVLIGPGVILSAAALISQRGDKADSAAVRQVLAESATHRANRHASAPPDGGEGAPAPTDGQHVPLATVLPFPAARRAA